jgi:hypothetical protein
MSINESRLNTLFELIEREDKLQEMYLLHIQKSKYRQEKFRKEIELWR